MRHHLILMLLIAPAAPALGQTPQALLACAAKVDDAERLACYDRAVEALSAEARRVTETRDLKRKEAAAAAAAAAATAAAAAEAAAAQQKADSFGREGVRAFRGEDDGRVSQVTAVLSEALRDQLGKIVFVLDNGQIWRQADAFRLPAVRPGARITIERGAMGSYLLSVNESNRRAQVIRMR